MEYHIKDPSLADKGLLRIEWAGQHMGVLKRLAIEHEGAFKGTRIAACLHITTETANLAIALKKAGATVRLCASNPLSTQDDVAAALVKHFGIEVFAIRGEDRDTYYEHIKRCLDFKPHITMDDGADLTSYAHKYNLTKGILGGTEETTTGVIRLRAMARDGVLHYPVIAVNDSRTKFLFDNRYGTGQSTIDGILRATNILIAGKTFTVAGYGWVGRGIAMRARGMGARVIVTEVDPIRAIEAYYDGFSVMPMEEAIKVSDIVVTATGNKHVIAENHIRVARDGIILANAGHFDVEIDKEALERLSVKVRRIRENVDEYTLEDGRRVFLLAEGRLVNLGAAEGHPSEVMDMSFSNQFMAVKYILDNHDRLEKKVYRLPDEIDVMIASLKLNVLGVKIDELTPEQKRYLSSWEEGT